MAPSSARPSHDGSSSSGALGQTQEANEAPNLDNEAPNLEPKPKLRHAAFQAAWAHLAAGADVTSEHAARAPVHTEDAIIAELAGSARALEALAEAS